MAILSWLFGRNNLYYPGCLTKFVLKDKLENYKEILNRLGIDFIILQDNVCCGSPVINAGYDKEAYNLASLNFELFNKKKIGKIITNCPACYKIFTQDYKRILPNWNIPAEHITATILSRLKEKPSLIKHPANEKIIYHDPCHLGRHSNIYEEPREVLKLLGYEIVELPDNRQNALCCGGGAGLKANETELSNKIAKLILTKIKAIGVNKIVSTCPLCFSQFKENFEKDGINVIEFSDAVLRVLK